MKQSQSLKYRTNVLEYDSVSRYLFKLVEIDQKDGLGTAPGIDILVEALREELAAIAEVLVIAVARIVVSWESLLN